LSQRKQILQEMQRKLDEEGSLTTLEVSEFQSRIICFPREVNQQPGASENYLGHFGGKESASMSRLL
jgi:hypothetical protein